MVWWKEGGWGGGMVRWRAVRDGGMDLESMRLKL